MTNFLAIKRKDPAASLPYTLNWGPYLHGAGDLTIGASTWTSSPAGLTLSDPVFTQTTATVEISGGTAGVRYTVTNQITTPGLSGITDRRSFAVDVQTR